MPIPLTSIEDPRIDVFRNLRTSKMERKAGLFVAEGMWLVRRLLQSHFETVCILADEKRLPEIGVPIAPHIPVYVLPNGLTEKVVGFNFHRGVIACGRRSLPLRAADLPRLADPQWIIICCAQVQDPENMGSILRNSAAFGAHSVLLGPNCSDPLSRRVMRVSMGASLKLPIAETADLAADLAYLRSSYGAVVAATVVDAQAEILETASRSDRLVLVFGSEGHGLPQELQDVCDRRLTIPMTALADSLNVANSSAVFLHYFSRISRIGQ
jgi:tRNA G18 (ribose-2'-O)-methylase SpoU